MFIETLKLPSFESLDNNELKLLFFKTDISYMPNANPTGNCKGNAK